MSKKLHTAEQIIPKPREAEVLLARGATVGQVTRISSTHTYSDSSRKTTGPVEKGLIVGREDGVFSDFTMLAASRNWTFSTGPTLF